MTHDEMIAILAAHRDGRKIEIRHVDSPVWVDYCSDCPPSLWGTNKYRIKPALVCKTSLRVRGEYCIYVEGGPEIARSLEQNHGLSLLREGDLAPFLLDGKDPREEFELRPV